MATSDQHFAGVTNPSSTEVGYDGESASNTDPGSPPQGTEIASVAGYDAIETDDTTYLTTSATTTAYYAFQMYSFYLPAGVVEADVTQIEFTWIGFFKNGVSAPFNNDGHVYIRQVVPGSGAQWTELAHVTDTDYTSHTYTITTSIAQYINSDKIYFLLLEQNGKPAPGISRVFTDFMRCIITYTAGGNVKTIDGVAIASVKTLDGTAIASVKRIDGILK